MRSNRRGSVSMTTGSSGTWIGRLGKAGRGGHPDEPPELDRFDRDLLGMRVEARDLHQVVDERAQPPHVRHEQLARAPALGGQRVEMFAQDRRLGDECGQRGPQLVRDVGDESTVLGFGRLEPPDGLGERLGHPVEALRPRPELVVRGDRHARGQVAVLDRLGGPAGGLDRRQDPAGDGPGDEERDEDERDRAHGQGRPELAERLVDGGHVVDEVEGGSRAADPAADDEARPAGDLDHA